MSTALDAIRKQAEAVKNNSNALKAAELLKQAAALLEAGAPKSAGFTREEKAGTIRSSYAQQFNRETR
jgi:hypothetical protein